MNRIYRIIWNSLLNQWIVASELAKRGKTHSIKPISLLALSGLSAYAMADCQINPNQIIVNQSAGTYCQISGEEYVGGDDNVVVVDNEGMAKFNANKVKLTSTGQNHALLVGNPESATDKGGFVDFQGNLTINSDANINSNNTKKDARASAIVLGNLSHLTINGNLQIDHHDHTNTTTFKPGSAIRLASKNLLNPSSLTVKGTTQITSNGDGILNGDESDPTKRGGKLQFDGEVNLKTENNGIINHAGTIIFKENVSIKSTNGSAIKQAPDHLSNSITSGIVAEKDVTLESNGNENTLNIYGGNSIFKGITILKASGNGDTEEASSTALFVKDGLVQFDNNVSATTYFPTTPGLFNHGNATAIKIKGGKTIINNSISFTSNSMYDTAYGLDISGGELILGTDSWGVTNQAPVINMTNGKISVTEDSLSMRLNTISAQTVINISGGEFTLTKFNDLISPGIDTKGITLSGGKLTLNGNTFIRVKSDCLSVSGGEINLLENSSTKLEAYSVENGSSLVMSGGKFTLADNTTLISSRENGITMTGGLINLNTSTSVQGALYGILMSGGEIRPLEDRDTELNITGIMNSITMNGGLFTLAKKSTLNMNYEFDNIIVNGGTLVFNELTDISSQEGNGINMSGGKILSTGSNPTLIINNSSSGKPINISGGEFDFNGQATISSRDNSIFISGGKARFNGVTDIKSEHFVPVQIENGEFTLSQNTTIHANSHTDEAISLRGGKLTLAGTTQFDTAGNPFIVMSGGTLHTAGELKSFSAPTPVWISSNVPNGETARIINSDKLVIDSDEHLNEDMINHNGAGTLNIANTATGNITKTNGLIFTNSSTGTIEVDNAGTMVGQLHPGNGIINLNNHSSGIWKLTADSAINNLTNAGRIQLSQPASITRSADAFHTLTIRENYHGQNGIIEMHTIWNKSEVGNEHSSQSDKLIIYGQADGTTTLVPVKDKEENIIDGNIQQVASAIDSNPVIYVHTSGGNVFTGTAKTTGASEVQLAKRTTDKGIDEYYWSMEALDDGSGKNIYADAVAGYTVMPRVNLEQGFASLGTLRERRGNMTCADCSISGNRHTWARAFGKHQKQDGKLRLNLDTDIYGLQIGHDFWAKQTANNGLNMLGAYLAYSHAATDFSDQYRARNGLIISDKKTGEGKSDSISLGLTNTYYGANGSYLDLVGQLSYLHNKYSARSGNNPDSQDGWGAAVSAEVGRTLPLRQSNWSVTPQAQLVYQLVDLDSFNDGIRHVDQNNQDALRGRVGLRLEYNAAGQAGKTASFYTVGNIWHDFINPSHVSIGRDSISEKFNTTWGEIGVGLQLPLARHSQLYGDVRYEHNFGSSKHQSFRGNIGFKVNW